MNKVNATTSQKAKPIHHTLREFLFALSYWGSWTRALLFFVMVTMMLAVSLSGQTLSSDYMWLSTLGITSVIVYAVCFFLYDATYVTIVRRNPLPYRIDRLALFIAEAIAVVTIFTLWLVYEGDVSMTSVYIAVFTAALILPLRAVAGILGRSR